MGDLIPHFFRGDIMIIDTWVTVFWRQYIDCNGDTIISHKLNVNDAKDEAINDLKKHHHSVTMNLDKLEGWCLDEEDDKWNFFIMNKHMWGKQDRDTHAIFGVRK